MALIKIFKDVVPLMLGPNEVTLHIFSINLDSLEVRSKARALPALPVYQGYFEEFRTRLERAKDCLIKHIEEYSEETVALHLKILEQQKRAEGKTFLYTGEILTKEGIRETSDLASQEEIDLIQNISAMFDDQMSRIDALITRLKEMEKKFSAMPD